MFDLIVNTPSSFDRSHVDCLYLSLKLRYLKGSKTFKLFSTISGRVDFPGTGRVDFPGIFSKNFYYKQPDKTYAKSQLD